MFNRSWEILYFYDVVRYDYDYDDKGAKTSSTRTLSVHETLKQANEAVNLHMLPYVNENRHQWHTERYRNMWDGFEAECRPRYARPDYFEVKVERRLKEEDPQSPPAPAVSHPAGESKDPTIYIVVRDNYDPHSIANRCTTDIVGLYTDKDQAAEAAEVHAKDHLKETVGNEDAEVLKVQGHGWVCRPDCRGQILFEVRIEKHSVHVKDEEAEVAVQFGGGNDASSRDGNHKDPQAHPAKRRKT